jgi:hypothetical protein
MVNGDDAAVTVANDLPRQTDVAPARELGLLGGTLFFLRRFHGHAGPVQFHIEE